MYVILDTTDNKHIGTVINTDFLTRDVINEELNKDISFIVLKIGVKMYRAISSNYTLLFKEV